MRGAYVAGIVAACATTPTDSALVRWPVAALTVRAPAACEAALVAAPHAHAFELDVLGSEGRERWVVTSGRVAILDASCTTVLASFAMDANATSPPSLTDSPWRDVPPSTIARMAATDRLPITTRHVLSAWGSQRAPVITLVELGPRETLQFGYRALAIVCDRSSCRASTFSHYELVAAPVETCHTVREVIGNRDEPLFALTRRGTEVVVEQRYQQRDTCRGRAPRQTLWRSARL